MELGSFSLVNFLGKRASGQGHKGCYVFLCVLFLPTSAAATLRKQPADELRTGFVRLYGTAPTSLPRTKSVQQRVCDWILLAASSFHHRLSVPCLLPVLSLMLMVSQPTCSSVGQHSTCCYCFWARACEQSRLGHGASAAQPTRSQQVALHGLQQPVNTLSPPRDKQVVSIEVQVSTRVLNAFEYRY